MSVPPKGLTIAGKAAICPVCKALRDDSVPLVTRGKSPLEDRILYCPACHREWESVRWYIEYWYPHWMPKIHKELREAAEDKQATNAGREEYAEWEWERIKRVREAVERGWWRPEVSESDLNLTMPLENFDDAVETYPDGSMRPRARKSPRHITPTRRTGCGTNAGESSRNR